MWLSCQSQLHRQTFTPWVDTWRIMADPCTRELVPQIQHNLIIWAVLYQLWNCWDFFVTIRVSEEPQPSVNCSRANGFFAWPANVSCQNFWDCREGEIQVPKTVSLIIYHFQEPPTNRLVQLESSLILNSTLVPLQIRNWERNEIFIANQLVEDFT